MGFKFTSAVCFLFFINVTFAQVRFMVGNEADLQNSPGAVPELRSVPEMDKKGWNPSEEFDSNEDSYDNWKQDDPLAGWAKRAAASWMVNNPNKFQRHGPSPIDFRMTRSVPYDKYYRNSKVPMAEYRKRMVAPSAPYNFQWEKEYSPIATEYKKRGPNFSLDFMDSLPSEAV